MESHSFSVELAAKYDINCALILNTFSFWHRKNIENKKNIYKDRVWMKMSVAQWNAIYAYLTPDKVRGALSRLEKEGLIEVDNFNRVKYDRTNWYCLTSKGCLDLRIDEYCSSENKDIVECHKTLATTDLGKPQMETGKSQMQAGIIPNGDRQNPKPITVTKKDTGTVIKDNPTSLPLSKKVDWVIDQFNKIMGKNVKKTTTSYRNAIIKQLKNGYTGIEFQMVFDCKYNEWKEEEKTRKWLNLITMCRHFEKYVDESIDYFKFSRSPDHKKYVKWIIDNVTQKEN